MFLAGGAGDDGGGYKSGCLNLSGGWGWDAHKDVSKMHLGMGGGERVVGKMGRLIFSKGMESNVNGRRS